MARRRRRTSRTERRPSGAYVVVDTSGKEHVRKKRTGKKALTEPVVAPADICSVIYCDEHLIAANKQAGYPVSPSGAYHRRSVLMALNELGFGELYPVNLLDREATGLVLFSRSKQTAKALRTRWRGPKCRREFLIVVEGDVTGARGRITFPIGSADNSRGGGRRQVMAIEDGGRPAVTSWRLVARGRGRSRILATIGGNRSQQIRIHMAAIGHPLVNDRSYVERATDVPLSALVELPERYREIRKMPNYQIAMHAGRIEILHPVTDQVLEFHVPPPRLLLDLMPGAWVVDPS
jgi:23S rRNA pseudouridine1911/1915/1917 synthase